MLFFCFAWFGCWRRLGFFPLAPCVLTVLVALRQREPFLSFLVQSLFRFVRQLSWPVVMFMSPFGASCSQVRVRSVGEGRHTVSGSPILRRAFFWPPFFVLVRNFPLSGVFSASCPMRTVGHGGFWFPTPVFISPFSFPALECPVALSFALPSSRLHCRSFSFFFFSCTLCQCAAAELDQF